MLQHIPFVRVPTLVLGILLLGIPFVSVHAAGGAVLSLAPGAGTYAAQKPFTIQVLVDSTQPFNSASGKLTFDKELLAVQTISKTSSALSLWAVEPSFSNAAGTIEFEGGNTSALTGKKVLLTVTFKGLKEGSATVRFASATVLAADGKGTDLTGAQNDATFTITTGTTAALPEAPAQEAGSLLGPKPEMPDVVSTTHPDPERYSNAPKARFTWELPPDVTVVRLALDTKENTIPTTSYDPAINEKEFDQLTDGMMYVHVRYKNDAGWGPTVHKKIMVDKTPPPSFPLTIAVAASGTDALLTFQATDTPSGIDRYELLVDGGVVIKVALTDVANGTYALGAQSPGAHTITVKAYDKGGNVTTAEGAFTIAGELRAPIPEQTDAEPKPIDKGLILNVSLIALVAFLIGYLWYERKLFRKEQYMAKREADELRDHCTNVFAALREEVDEQTGTLFAQPNPSAHDRAVAEHLSEAIDLSEELIAKEIEDVRKLLG